MTDKPASSHRRRWLWPVLKWSVFVLVVGFVIRHGLRLWRGVDSHTLTIHWGWLAGATVCSVIAWAPSMWLWKQLLADLGAHPPWSQVLRAYYCGHPGKYVPGKATVILIRAALLKPSGIPAATTALTVTIDSLTYIASGSVLIVLLLPWLLAGISRFESLAELAQQPVWMVAIAVTACIASVAGLAVLCRLSVRLMHRFQSLAPGEVPVGREIQWTTLARGFGVFLGGWWLQGLTLGCVLQGLSATAIDWKAWPMWTGASAVSLAGGFFAIFAPGGLGVREGLLMELLKSQVGPHEAVAAAIVLRGVSLVGELLAAGIVYIAIPAPTPTGERRDVSPPVLPRTEDVQ